MCFQFGARRKGPKTQSTLFATTPQTLLTSTSPGEVKVVRFDSKTPDSVPSPTRHLIRKCTPSQGGGEGAAAQALQFAGDVGEKDDEVDPMRKQVRQATPWHCSSDTNAATASHIRSATTSCIDEDAIPSGGGKEHTAEVRTPKVAQWPTPMQTVADEDKSSRHIHWSVSAEQAFQARHSDEVAKTDSTRRPDRKATPFTSSAEAAEGNEEKDRHIQWSESVEELSARRTDRKGTPWHTAVDTPTCGEQVDRHIEWSDSVEEPSDRRPDRKGTPWPSGAQNANCKEETDAHIRWSESVQDISARRADRKCTPWHAVDAQATDTEETERADLEQEAPMYAAAEEVVLEPSIKTVETNNKVAPKGLSLFTAFCMCQPSPSESTVELQI